VSELTALTLAAARDGLKKKDFSAVELADAHLVAIEKARALNAYVLETPERALAMAKAADARIHAGKAHALEGIPIAVKDLFATEGVRTTACSHILDNFVPTYESTVTSQLWRDGAVLLGKTNNDEFAMGSSNETSHFGPVTSPWRRKGSNTPLVPGGSSGGSAAAVAARMAPAAIGTDTGGSIRQPAALTGICGLKPTYGVVSRYGMIAFASSLDQGGPMAKSAEDLALMLNVMAGFDARDSTSLERPAEDYTRLLDASPAGDRAKPLSGLRIGVPKEYFGAGLASDVGAAVEAALAQFEKLGAQRVAVSLPNSALSVPAYYVIAPAEASSNLSRFDGVRYGYRAPEYTDLADMYRKTRAQGFGAEVKRRILIGTYVLSHGYYDAYYLKAQKIRRLIARDFAEAYAQCDLIMGPTSPSVAFAIGAKASDPVQMYLNDIYTVAANLAGLPALSIPCGFGEGNMPVGLHLAGNYFAEARMLQAAHQYQLATDWHMLQPAGVE